MTRICLFHASILPTDTENDIEAITNDARAYAESERLSRQDCKMYKSSTEITIWGTLPVTIS